MVGKADWFTRLVIEPASVALLYEPGREWLFSLGDGDESESRTRLRCGYAEGAAVVAAGGGRGGSELWKTPV